MESVSPGTSPLSRSKGQKWDHLAVILMKDGDNWTLTIGTEFFEGQAAWDRINSLGEEGWELVSAVPILGEKQVSSLIEFLGTSPQFVNFTEGQWLWFRRIRS